MCRPIQIFVHSSRDAICFYAWSIELPSCASILPADTSTALCSTKPHGPYHSSSRVSSKSSSSRKSSGESSKGSLVVVVESLRVLVHSEPIRESSEIVEVHLVLLRGCFFQGDQFAALSADLCAIAPGVPSLFFMVDPNMSIMPPG